MAFRDDHAAALARASSLERDLARERKRAEKAERKLAALKAEAEARARGEPAKPAPVKPVPVKPAAAPPAPVEREVPARSALPWRREADGANDGGGGTFVLIWLLVFVIAGGAIAAMLAIIG